MIPSPFSPEFFSVVWEAPPVTEADFADSEHRCLSERCAGRSHKKCTKKCIACRERCTCECHS